MSCLNDLITAQSFQTTIEYNEEQFCNTLPGALRDYVLFIASIFFIRDIKKKRSFL